MNLCLYVPKPLHTRPYPLCNGTSTYTILLCIQAIDTKRFPDPLCVHMYPLYIDLAPRPRPGPSTYIDLAPVRRPGSSM